MRASALVRASQMASRCTYTLVMSGRLFCGHYMHPLQINQGWLQERERGTCMRACVRDISRCWKPGSTCIIACRALGISTGTSVTVCPVVSRVRVRFPAVQCRDGCGGARQQRRRWGRRRRADRSDPTLTGARGDDDEGLTTHLLKLTVAFPISRFCAQRRRPVKRPQQQLCSQSQLISQSERAANLPETMHSIGGRTRSRTLVLTPILSYKYSKKAGLTNA